MPGLYGDDRHLLAALWNRGLAAEPVVWEDPYQDWSEPRLTVVRSAWDYAYRLPQFLDWAERAARGSYLWNSLSVIRWNTHKRYLCDLLERGVSVVPTLQLSAGSKADLRALIEDHDWEEVVIKAAVAQAGRYAMRVSLDSIAQGQAHLDRYLPHEDMLVQRYMPGVLDYGELSLVFVDGEFTHAVRKRTTRDDFRVHSDFGGTERLERPDQGELAVARAALDAVGEPTLYARVDVVRDQAGAAAIMEFELVEPELFLRFSPDAVELLCDGIERRLGR